MFCVNFVVLACCEHSCSPLAGLDMGKMMQMASSMMQQNPNMMRNIQQMMGGGR